MTYLRRVVDLFMWEFQEEWSHNWFTHLCAVNQRVHVSAKLFTQFQVSAINLSHLAVISKWRLTEFALVIQIKE